MFVRFALCVCVCARARERACACVCMRACVRVRCWLVSWSFLFPFVLGCLLACLILFVRFFPGRSLIFSSVPFYLLVYSSERSIKSLFFHWDHRAVRMDVTLSMSINYSLPTAVVDFFFFFFFY